MQVSTGREFFSWISCRKLSQNRFPQPLSTLPQLFIRLHKQKRLSGLRYAHCIAWGSSREHFSVRSVADRWSAQCTLQTQNNFFQLFFPFARIYYDCHHLESCLECVFSNNPQQLLSANLNSRLQEKSFSRGFRLFIEKTRLFGKIFCFRIPIFFT